MVPFGTTQDRISHLNYNLVDGIVKSGYPTLRDDWFHLEPQGNKILQLNNKNLCGGHRQAVKTMDCGSIMRGFESHCPPHLYIKKTLLKGLFYCSILG